MAAFYLTFPDEYGNGQIHERWLPANGRGYVKIIAENAVEAKVFAQSHFGLGYSQIFTSEEFSPQLYPLGELTTIGSLLHSPIERYLKDANGKPSREILCSCVTVGEGQIGILWSTPGHGSNRRKS